MHFIKCSEIWGGIKSANRDIKTKGLAASLYCQPFESGHGGDLYYFSVCGKDILTRIAIGDVAGHGESVSKVSGQLYESLLRNMNKQKGKEVLSEMNEVIWGETPKPITTAAVYTVNRADSTLSFSTAGHPPFFMKRKESNDWNEVILQKHTPKGNIPLGTLSGTHFDEESISVKPGDKFFFLTDGLLEVFDRKGQMFGKFDLLPVLKRNNSSPPEKLKQAVLNALTEHIKGGLIRDDLTFMAIEIT